MKTIGLLGGMSWESTQVYYRQLNQLINQQLGGLHSAELVLVNVDFEPIEKLMVQGEWAQIADILIKHCLQIQAAGADFLLIATNTMHQLCQPIEQALDIPLLHIADAVGQDISLQNKQKVGLLGTEFTMEQAFYHERLSTQFGIETITPNQVDRTTINQIIFKELCQGIFSESAKQCYLAIIDKLAAQGAEAVVLACTEIGLLINQTDSKVPLIDATESHIRKAVQLATTDQTSINTFSM
ncbi:aspartate/glutamate racemase family protein [Marinicella litoralis]|uniref:Aspartate racemase n=1 Tax=Marinicella litoralis TaxID=644220 RepID=A0A4R6XZX9_9GAMM|nr:aspartate/glutamate racemase family protein [Marinicella litoralis]TDR23887.1 aspartate racemase [Marinicella litoralis]